MDGILLARQVVECWPQKDRKQKDRTSPVWGLRRPGLFSGGRGRTAEPCQQAFFFSLAGAEDIVYTPPSITSGT